MATRHSPPPALLTAAFGLASRHADLLIIFALTILAAALRLWGLDSMPPGVHGDEAQYGLDGQRVLREGWIGPYTTSALGQPAGIAYVTAIGQALFGATALGARFGIALVATATIPLAYVFFRLTTTRVTATIAAFFIAVSTWHLLFSRVAYQPALLPPIELAVLILWTLASRRGDWRLFAEAGAVLGLGVYTYTVYPMFVLAFSVWVAIDTVVAHRGPELGRWLRNVAVAAVVSFVVALPLIAYALNPANDFFEHYEQYYEQYSALQSPAFREADRLGKVEIVGEQAWRFVGAYAWDGIPDLVDGSAPDGRPMLDIVTLALLVVGGVIAVRRWREGPYLICLVVLAIVPLTGVTQTNAIYRGPLGVLPFLALLAATPLGLVWTKASVLGQSYREAVYTAVGLVLLGFAFLNLGKYNDWTSDPLYGWVFTEPISAASEYIESLPGTPYVYFYSERWSYFYETRLYLAPDVVGEDRSFEFGLRWDYGIDRSRDAVIVLLGPYQGVLPVLNTLYPTGRAYIEGDERETLFVAYEVPRE